MAYADVGRWKYFRGGRDYIIKWTHADTGEEVELEPIEGQSQEVSWDPDKNMWEAIWRDESGNDDDVGTGTERKVLAKARNFMLRHPCGKTVKKVGGRCPRQKR